MIQATIKDRALVADILVEAFSPLNEDNSINFVVKQDEKRLERMRILMEYLFDKAMRTGYVFLSDNKASCLLLTYAQNDKFSWPVLVSTLKLAFRCIGITRVFSVLKRQRIIKRNYPKTNYVRPMIFAVKNKYQGGVTAPKLIMQVYARFKNHNMPIIVDTASEKNMKLYEKFGLKVFNIEKELGFPIYLLRMNKIPSNI